MALAQGTPTPTPDRLAAPPTVPSPNQADEGAQLYWLYCQPCHGDKGQGLTDEWRAQFPEEDQYCWGSGCHGTHGKDKPEFGFVLPTAVPPLTTEDSLPQYQNMAQFYYYIRQTMPLEMPGRLTKEEYLAITAHIAREHGIWDGITLTEENVSLVKLRPAAKEPPASQTPLAPQTMDDDLSKPAGIFSSPLLALGGVVFFMLATGGIWLWRRQI
jgi:cytochrome c